MSSSLEWDSKVANRMEWFGLSLYGCPDPIKDMMRPDYKEPVDPPTGTHHRQNFRSSYIPFWKFHPEPEVNIILRPEFECNSGPPDGFAYNSHRRLIALRNKAIRKPVGKYKI